jgi:hypothetical protein
MRVMVRAVMAAAVFGACVVAPGVAAADPSFVAPVAVASPGVVRPGEKVHFGLDCGRRSKAAALTGVTGGRPHDMRRTGVQAFALSVRVPPKARAGRYHVDMQCANGESALTVFDVVEMPHATGAVSPRVGHRGHPVDFGLACAHRAAAATLRGRSIGLRRDVAMSPSGAALFGATVKLPKHMARGRYRVKLRCSDGSAVRITLRVR